MNELTVSVSPHIRGKRTTKNIMLDVIIALMPALVASVKIFGARSLLLTAVSAAVCVLCEYLWEKGHKMPLTIGDLSAVVTGILLAYNVPVGMPIWQLIVGDAAAILVAKMLFGGIGCNFMNPALVGRIVLMFSFTSEMTTYVFPKTSIDALSSATPLTVLDKLNMSDLPQLMYGVHGGVIGETCMIALLIGGVYLIVRKVISPAIPLSYLGATLLFTWAFGGAQPILALFSGGVMLGAVFMATDYTTSPMSAKGQFIYAAGCGIIVVIIRNFCNYPEGVTYAILVMNIVTPLLDKYVKPRLYGRLKEEKANG